ncbi:MAG: DUF5682 family protein [Myxococcota bacterium]
MTRRSTTPAKTEPRIIGVRHHSPACSRLVSHVIDEVQPRHVLIEGPADMNERLDELDADHRLPIAIFSYHRGEAGAHASWSPFCDYSPEWVALRHGRKIGAQVRFMDLPAWASAFGDVRNRYADGDRPRLDYVTSLCRRLGMDGMDSLWDHLFELDLTAPQLEARLAPYFEALRHSGGDDRSDDEREAFMAQCIAAAVAEGGDVVVVCGGYHKPALERAWPNAEATWPEVPVPAADARHGSYLVPYSFHRLDSFVGYQSGMPSPGYYQAVWDNGAQAAADSMLRSAVRRLRDAKQPISAADIIAAQSMSRGLMRLRGHEVMARSDLLDGLSAALLKHAQTARLPWTQRGPLAPGTDPIVVELVAALSGTREGRLDERTPLPPLVADANAWLERLALVPTRRERTVTLDLTKADDLARSRLLHRLAILQVGGFAKADAGGEASLDEHWTLHRARTQASDLVEAGAWGGTVESAATARLEDALVDPDASVVLLSDVLHRAVAAGLLALIGRVVTRIAAAMKNQTHVGELGTATLRLLGTWRHDALHGAAGHAGLAAVLHAAFDRLLWLFEGLHGATAPLETGHVRAAIALRDCVRFGDGVVVTEPEAARGVMRRRTVDAAAPVAVRGAALGFLWSLGELGSNTEAEETAIAGVRGSASPSQLGDFLTGVFALAREEVSDATSEHDGLIAAIDRLLQAMSAEDFLVAVPSLRMAFGFFPPREKDRLARRLLRLHGDDATTVSTLRQIAATPETMTRGVRLEAMIDAVTARYGLERPGGDDG